MVLFDRLFDIFCGHVAVINEDQIALRAEVEILQKKYGPWIRIRGFSDFRQLFLALHLAKAKHRPYSMAFIRANEPTAGELILKKADPAILTYKYSDTQQLSAFLPKLT